MPSHPRLHLVLALLLAPGLTACGGHDPVLGPPTGAACPPAATLTYDSFGREFMTAYCVECHDSELHGADRQGAPSFHDFDTLEGIQAVAEHVDQSAGSGPDATNDQMPPGDYSPRPSRTEREDLARWLACGAP